MPQFSQRGSALALSGLLLVSSAQAESVCFGTASDGHLEGGVQIPTSGPNIRPYSALGVTMGRTYVHAKVAAVLQRSYLALETQAPGKLFVYGESGWAKGGSIKPHRTHQNGTAVDLMVPVLDAQGVSVPLPSSAANKFGYGLEFDKQGRYETLRIDFDAIAEHLYALDAAAKAEGITVARVIFEKAYISKLYATRRGPWIRQNVRFMQAEPWIRHDEHYHVDFGIPCRPWKG